MQINHSSVKPAHFSTSTSQSVSTENSKPNILPQSPSLPKDATRLKDYSQHQFKYKSVDFDEQLQIKQAQKSVSSQIQDFSSQHPDEFKESMKQVLGNKLSDHHIDKLLKQAQSGDFPIPQNIRFVSDETLKGNKAAYSPENGGTVFLSESLKGNQAALAYALSEEVGHHLDAVIGGPDSVGDEGQIFAEALRKKGPVDEEFLEIARLDNDKGVIKVDGKDIEVEFIAPAVVGAAIWAGKVAATTAVDAALDITIAALTGMPPPGPGTHVLNAIANAIPWLGEANTGKKVAKLGIAVEKAISTLNKLKHVPGGEQIVRRLDDLYKTAKQAFEAGDFAKVKNALGSLVNELGDAQKLARGVNNSTVKLVNKANIPAASFPAGKLQKKYKHAGDFGVTGNFNNANRALFERNLKNHIGKDSTIAIEGVYKRGATPEKVIHYYDPQTQLNVITKPNGEFISGWKLSEKQREYILSVGSLGGG